MRVFCDLSVSRDDGEPMSFWEIAALKKAVAESGLAGTILQEIPYIAGDNTNIVWNSKGPTDWDSFHQQVIEMSAGMCDYLMTRTR